MVDLVAKAQDWAMADQIAKRAKALLPPPIQQAEAAENGEPPPPPSPQEIAQQQAEQRQLAEQQHQLEFGKRQVEQQRLRAEMAKVGAWLQQAQIERRTRAMDVAHPTAPGSAAPAADSRIDAIGQAVEHLGAVVSMMMEAMGGGNAHPPAQEGPPQPDQSPPGFSGPDHSQAPQGAFFIDPSAVAAGPAPIPGPALT